MNASTSPSSISLQHEHYLHKMTSRLQRCCQIEQNVDCVFSHEVLSLLLSNEIDDVLTLLIGGHGSGQHFSHQNVAVGGHEATHTAPGKPTTYTLSYYRIPLSHTNKGNCLL